MAWRERPDLGPVQSIRWFFGPYLTRAQRTRVKKRRQKQAREEGPTANTPDSDGSGQRVDEYV